MTKNYYNIYISAALAVVVPLPPRFAYGVLAVLLLNFLVYAGLLTKLFVAKLHLERFLTVLVAFSTAAFAVLYKLLLNACAPLLSLTCGFGLYMVAFSSYVVGNVLDTVGLEFREHCKRTALRVLVFSAALLLFFLLRDILAFGTLTLPAAHGLKVLRLFATGESYPLYFLGTIPGTLVLSGLLVCLFSVANRKMLILRRAER